MTNRRVFRIPDLTSDDNLGGCSWLTDAMVGRLAPHLAECFQRMPEDQLAELEAGIDSGPAGALRIRIIGGLLHVAGANGRVFLTLPADIIIDDESMRMH